MKGELINSVKEYLNRLVDARTRELEDKKRSDNNIVLFNVAEHRSLNGVENKRNDEASIKDISSNLGLDNPKIQLCFRLGKFNPTSNRPLKVVFGNRAHRKYLLDNARCISEKAPEHLKKVIIFRALTTEQRTERRNRRRQRAWQTRGAEETEMLGRAAQTRIQFVKPDTVEMNIDYHPPSSIHGKHLCLHENNIMENQQSEYDQSTFIGGDTIIGGLSKENEPSLTNANTNS